MIPKHSVGVFQCERTYSLLYSPFKMRCVSILTLIIVSFADISVQEPMLRTCEPIRVELCKNLGYNMTGMPNLSGNDLQQEADYNIKSFSPLIQYGCSPQLKLFLCSVYVPMCTEKVSNPIGPCRGLCESVFSRCYPVLSEFGFPWPDALDCSRFPVENNQDHMCMEGPKEMRIVDVKSPVNPAVANCPPGHVPDLMAGCVSRCDSTLIFDEAEKRFAEVCTFDIIKIVKFACLEHV